MLAAWALLWAYSIMWGAVLGARGTLVEETRPGFCSFITKVASNAHLESGPC